MASNKLWAAALLLAALPACSRKNNPLLSSPGAGVTSATLSVPLIDTHDEPFNRVYAKILDNNGAAVTSLQTGNFSILENGRPGVIEQAGPATDPLYMVLVIDRSGSMSGSNETAANNAATTLVNTIGGSDQMAIVEFANSTTVSVPFTSSKATLLSVLTSGRSTGGTALYKATNDGAQLLKSMSGRKLLLVLTDGDDTGSGSFTINDAINGVNDAGVSGYMVALGSGIDLSTLQTIASGTNGEAYYSATGSDLGTIFLTVYDKVQNLICVKYRKRAASGTLTLYLNYGSITASNTRRF